MYYYGDFEWLKYLSSELKFCKKKLIFSDEFLVVINSSVSMFPLNLQLTPTHIHNIAVIIKGRLSNVYLLQLSHVTIINRYF